MYCQKCGLKLPDETGKCDICGYQIPSPNQARFSWIVVVFVLLTPVIFLVGKQASKTAVDSASNSVTQSQPQTAEVVNPEQAVEAARTPPKTGLSTDALFEQVNPPEGFTLPAVYGDLGPKLLEAGAIDQSRFIQTYERAGQPLTDAQLAILTEVSDEPIVTNKENAYFLLNFFWAVGLTNRNPVLTQGMIVQASKGNIERYASTGGWTLGTKPATTLYASAPLISLTPEQQQLVEKVAESVYRPCCNNHTAFPDCNHGMAMLGLLELMASQGATEDEMFTAAKYLNAFWFPQQALETAAFFQTALDLDYADADGRMAVGPEVFSSSGFQQVRQWLVEGGEMPQGPRGGNSCGV
jgi:hypothetical protein